MIVKRTSELPVPGAYCNLVLILELNTGSNSWSLDHLSLPLALDRDTTAMELVEGDILKTVQTKLMSQTGNHAKLAQLVAELAKTGQYQSRL